MQASRLNEKEGGGENEYNPVLVENLRLAKFQTTFALTCDSTASIGDVGVVFNATDRNAFSYVAIIHSSTVQNPTGYLITPTASPATRSGTHPANIPTCASGDTLWARVQFDGTTLTVKAINTPTAPSETTWSSTTACYSSTAFSGGSGRI